MKAGLQPPDQSRPGTNKPCRPRRSETASSGLNARNSVWRPRNLERMVFTTLLAADFAGSSRPKEAPPQAEVRGARPHGHPEPPVAPALLRLLLCPSGSYSTGGGLVKASKGTRCTGPEDRTAEGPGTLSIGLKRGGRACIRTWASRPACTAHRCTSQVQP